MPKVHVVILRDRLTWLAAKYYGTDSKAPLIVAANPQIIGRPISLENYPEIYPGDILTIPDETTNIVNFPEAPGLPPKIAVLKPGEISFLIGGTIFRHFTAYELNQTMDSLDSIAFSVPVDEKQILFQLTFSPFSYKEIGVYYNGFLVFGGTMIDVISESNPNSKTVQIACYPKCGVLNDCNAPISLYPIEFENQTLKQIATKLSSPFGIQAIFNDSEGNAFKRVAPEPEQKIFSFLSELAAQRNLIISNTSQGNLLFWKADAASAPIANIREGSRPFISCSPAFQPQTYYSHITGFLPTTPEKDSERHTWENPFLKSSGVLRPFNFTVEDSDSSDLIASVLQKAGRMFGNSCSYTLTVQGHSDQFGSQYQKNTSINVFAPGAMIVRDTTFIIRSLVKSRTVDGGDSTTMNLVLPGAFSGDVPKVVPWAL